MAEIQMVRAGSQSVKSGNTGKTGRDVLSLDFSEMLREKGQGPKCADSAAVADDSRVQGAVKDMTQKEEKQEPASSLEPTEEGLSAAMEILVQNMMQSSPEATAQEPVVVDQSLTPVEPVSVPVEWSEEAVPVTEPLPSVTVQETPVPAVTVQETQSSVALQETTDEPVAAVSTVEPKRVESRQEEPQGKEKETSAAPAENDVRPAEQAVQKESHAASENSSETRQDARDVNENRSEQTEEGLQSAQMLHGQISAAMVQPDADAAQTVGWKEDLSVVKTTPETLPRDVGEAIISRLPLKNGELTLELEPASLGKITVRMVFEDGKAVVSLFSANSKTLEILSHKAGEMAQILEEKTGDKTLVYVPEQHFAQDDPGGQEQGSRQQREGREYEGRKHQTGQQTESFMHQLRLGLA